MTEANTRAVSISKHERDHVVAVCFAALITLQANPDVALSYNDVEVDVLITPSTGHVVATIGDPAKHPPHMALSRQIAGLAALGPAARVDGALALLRAKDYGALAQAAKLSSEDLELLTHVQGPDATVRLARVILATKAYYDGIGTVGQQRMAKALRHGSNQGLRSWCAAEIIPLHTAQKMLTEADAQLSAIMGAKDTDQTAMDEVRRIAQRAEREAAWAQHKEAGNG